MVLSSKYIQNLILTCDFLCLPPGLNHNISHLDYSHRFLASPCFCIWPTSVYSRQRTAIVILVNHPLGHLRSCSKLNSSYNVSLSVQPEVLTGGHKALHNLVHPVYVPLLPPPLKPHWIPLLPLNITGMFLVPFNYFLFLEHPVPQISEWVTASRLSSPCLKSPSL